MKYLLLPLLWLLFSAQLQSQHINFEEYYLPNGLHVILHQDNTIPIVTTSVLYHVGSRDKDPERTGFAHFFEHLLFEGTKNIYKGNGSKSFHQMEAQITRLQQTILLVIKKIFPQISYN